MTWLSFKEGQHKIGELNNVSMVDVAFRLAHINRFNGSVGQYSVAQHCVLVSDCLPGRHKLAGLLRGMHKAYIGDIMTPVKALSAHLCALEDHYLDQIDDCFRVQTRSDAVTRADRAMLAAEAHWFGIPTNGWDLPEPALVTIEQWAPEYAALVYLESFKELTS